MKYYQVCWADKYDAGYCGVIPGFFTSKEEAERCAEWHTKHPDPTMNIRCDIAELDLDNIIDKFVPPMTDEEYTRRLDEFFYPDYSEEQYLEDCENAECPEQ